MRSVRMIEVNIDNLELLEGGGIPWRDMIEGLDLPRIDGALMLYDVLNHRSIAAVPDILGEFLQPDFQCQVSRPSMSNQQHMRLRRKHIARLLISLPTCIGWVIGCLGY